MTVRIREAATILGVTRQTVYKFLKEYEKDLNKHIIVIDDVRMIDESGIQFLRTVIKKQTSDNQNDKENDSKETDERHVNSLSLLQSAYKDHVKVFEMLISDKDKQIERLIRQVDEQQKQIMELQKALMNRLELESREQKDERKRSGLFSWLFRG